MQYIEDRKGVKVLVQDFFVHLWGEAPKSNINSSFKSKNSTYGSKTKKIVSGLFVIMGL